MAPRFLSRLVLGGLLVSATASIAFGQYSARPRLTFRDPDAKELKSAIAADNLDRIHSLLAGISTNDCLELDEQGRTALHYALQRCLVGSNDAASFQLLDELSARGPCVNAPDRLGRKPILDLAPLDWTNRARMDALKILMAHGADVNAQDENGSTLLHKLLRTWNDSAVHWPELLRLLLAAKANPNLTNSSDETPLHAFFGPQGFCTNVSGVSATRIGTAQKSFTLLMRAGADLTIKDKAGTTPLGTLLLEDEPFFGTKESILGFASSGMSNLLHVESATIKQRPALIYLCDEARADADLIQRLLDLGAKPAQAEPNGFTALHGAAWFYNYRACAALLERGASANAQDQSGRTPLHELARSTYCRSGYFETDQAADIVATADVLLVHGADRQLKDRSGKTALDLLKAAAPPPDEEQADLWRQLRKKLR